MLVVGSAEPSVYIVGGVQLSVATPVVLGLPQTLDTPLPPQVLSASQVPHSIILPQPSEIWPQFLPSSPQVIALQPRRSQRYWRWAAVGALAASAMIGVVVEQRRSDRREAEAAEAQLYETLLLVGEKMNQARTEIRGVRTEGIVQ